jgi:hypothetical protein
LRVGGSHRNETTRFKQWKNSHDHENRLCCALFVSKLLKNKPISN